MSSVPSFLPTVVPTPDHILLGGESQRILHPYQMGECGLFTISLSFYFCLFGAITQGQSASLQGKQNTNWKQNAYLSLLQKARILQLTLSHFLSWFGGEKAFSSPPPNQLPLCWSSPYIHGGSWGCWQPQHCGGSASSLQGSPVLRRGHLVPFVLSSGAEPRFSDNRRTHLTSCCSQFNTGLKLERTEVQLSGEGVGWEVKGSAPWSSLSDHELDDLPPGHNITFCYEEPAKVISSETCGATVIAHTPWEGVREDCQGDLESQDVEF